MVKTLIQKHWKHLAAILVFLALTVFNFHPRLQGKVIQSGDVVQLRGSQNELIEHREKTGENAYWTNSIFSGMPSYYITFKRNRDLVDHTRSIMRAGLPAEAGNFLLGMICFYILMIILGVNPWLSIVGAIAFAFTTNNIILLDAGHGTKIATVMSAPLVIAGVILSYRKKWLLGFFVFALGMAMNLKGDHPQMTYYLGLCLIPYVILLFVEHIRNKTIKDFSISSVVLLAGLLVGVGTVSSKLMPVNEYSKDTMRGKPILENNASSYSSSSVEGLSWDYAMNWSNGWEDLMQSFIPMVVGGSSAESMGSDTHFAKELRKRGMNTRSGVTAPMYWGSLPFTSGPIYFGAVIFLFFFIGLFNIEGNIKWCVLSAVLLTALLSLGKNFDVLSRFFYEYVPMYNKFRTPNSILTVTAAFIPILAMLGLQNIVKTKKINFKKVIIPGLGLAAFCVLVGLVGPGFSDMSGAYDARYEQMGISSSILKADRADLMSASSYRSALLMLLSVGLVYLFSKEKIKKSWLIAGVALISIGDLISTNFNYFKPSDYISSRTYQNNFTPRAVDKQILKDNDPHYRVHDLSIASFESAASSYHHKTIGGYHAAKLQRYQDLIDYHLSKNNMNVLNMLNTKYVITAGQDGNPSMQRNTAALGNAWFVNNIRMVNTADDEINQLSNFDPLAEAIVHKEFESYTAGLQPNKNGNISLTSYAPNELTYTSNSSSDQLAVFSEIWYGPNKGWKAYIDDNPVDHIRANYVLRALKVPAGSHTVKFVFDPDSVKTGFIISFICSLIIIGVLFFLLFNYFKSLKGTDS